MKEKLINFIEDYEEGLAKDFESKWQDIGYYNYCLGMKASCMSAKTLINNTNTKDLESVLKQEQSKINTNDYNGIEKTYYNGAYNMYNYILEKMEKEV